NESDFIAKYGFQHAGLEWDKTYGFSNVVRDTSDQKEERELFLGTEGALVIHNKVPIPDATALAQVVPRGAPRQAHASSGEPYDSEEPKEPRQRSVLESGILPKPGKPITTELIEVLTSQARTNPYARTALTILFTSQEYPLATWEPEAWGRFLDWSSRPER